MDRLPAYITICVVLALALPRIAAPATQLQDSDVVHDCLIECAVKHPSLDPGYQSCLTKCWSETEGELANQLIDVLVDPRSEPQIRELAGTALGMIGPHSGEGVPRLLRALGDANSEVRRNAAAALAEYGSQAEPALVALIRALQDPDMGVRGNAAAALGHVGLDTPEVVHALIALIRDTREAASVRSKATEALGAINPQMPQAADALMMALRDHSAVVRSTAAESLGSLGQTLLRTSPQRFNTTLAMLRDATQDSDPKVRENASASVSTLRTVQQARLTRACMIVLLLLYSFLLVSWLALLWRNPQALLQINSAFESFSESRLHRTIRFLTVLPRYVLLFGFFYRSRRVLDAWIAEHIGPARANFERNQVARAQHIFVPIPVKLDGAAMPVLSAPQLQLIAAKPRWTLRILGQAGAGKTTQGWQVARWAMAPEADQRLCREHVMIPVWIDCRQRPDMLVNRAAFLSVVRERLRDLLGTAAMLPSSLLKNLLRAQRLLVVLDGVPDVTTPSQDSADFEDAFDLPARALMVTSRLGRDSRRGHQSTVEIPPIRAEHASLILDRHLAQHGHRLRLKDVDDGFQRLFLEVTDRGITPLFARLCATQIFLNRQSDILHAIPNVMRSYVCELDKGPEPRPLNDFNVQRYAKIVAWECLKQTFRAAPGNRREVMAALHSAGGGNEILDYFEYRLQLIESTGDDEIRYLLDPLCEYYAAMGVVERHGDATDRWEAFFAALDGKARASRWFLTALWDCCLSISEYTAPQTVPLRLAKRLGLEPDQPFCAGPPVEKRSRLFGRDGLIRDITQELGFSSVLLLGARRSGKTSVLHQIREECAATWSVAFVDLHGYAGLPDQRCVADLQSEIARASDLQSFTAEVDRPLGWLRDMVEQSGTTRLLIIVDELATLASHPHVAMQLRALSKWSNPRTRLVVAGSERDLDRLTEATQKQGYGSAFTNEFTIVSLKRLEPEEARKLLETQVHGFYRFEPQALAALLESGAGRPIILNVLGKLAMRAAQAQGARLIAADEVAAAMVDAWRRLGRWYRDFVGDLDPRIGATLPTLVADVAADALVPSEHAEVLHDAGLTVGGSEAPIWDPLFIEWARREESALWPVTL